MAEDELNELPSIDGAPWLMCTHENDDDATLDKQTFFSMNNHTSYVKQFVELQGKSIVGSSVGWLILRERQNSTMYSLWNPITRQSILLPELVGKSYGRAAEWCFLTSPPYEDGFDNATRCFLLIMISGVVFSCRITSTRDDYMWVKHRPKRNGRSAHLYTGAVLNGDIYALVYMLVDKEDDDVVDKEDDNDFNDNEDNDGVDNEDNDGIENEDGDGIDNKDHDGVDNEDNYGIDNEDGDDFFDEDNDVVDDKNDNEDDDDGGHSYLFVRLKVSDDSDGNTSILIERLSVGYPFSSIVCHLQRRDMYYLVEVCGELYVVYIIARQVENLNGYDILKAFVSRWDMPKREWIQVESLGDRAFLLGGYCCTWCWAYDSNGRIEGNSIYMANFRNDPLHQYRLQDASYTFVSSHTNFCFSSRLPLWFMPHNPTRFPSLVGKTEQVIIKNTKYVDELLEDTIAEIVPASSLLQLPPEIIISIADRMHWFDCMNFRATCKMMRSEIPKPQLKANSPFPLFMFLSNTQGICELWDPCYQNNGSITKKLPYSTSIVSTIEFCKDDWLILRSGCYLQYMNIFTGERCEYPTENLPGGLSSFAFSTCPTSPDCLTVGIKGTFNIIISLLQAGDDEWEVFGFESRNGDVYFRKFFKSSPKYHDGAFYFLGENSNLGVFEIMDGECVFETHKGPIRNDNPSKIRLDECYIAELGEQLVYVFIQPFGSSVKVYSFDMDQELWVELKSLGDYTLFVSAASSFSVPTKDSSMKNRIYLPKRMGNEMVFYSLDTGKYHTSNSKDSFENYCGMKSQSFCCWV